MPVYTAVSEVADDMQVTQHEVDCPQNAISDHLASRGLDPLFEAVVQAIDEAVIDAMVANREMVGRDGHRVRALPHDGLRALLRRYGRSQ